MPRTSEVAADLERIIAGEVGHGPAARIVRAIQKEMGGQQIYLPRRPHVTDAEIMGLFDGSNHREVIAELGINRPRLYRAIRNSVSTTHS